ncbi:MAG: DUF5596 domain-containing protein [Lachnospiraceae bacterium]|nr:DUF5596 domain-containing protein [Lachnospiraceae bacterium]
MTLQELYFRIELPCEAVAKLQEIEKGLDIRSLEALLDGLGDYRRAAEAYEKLKESLLEDEGQWKMLYCQLECARRSWKRYEEMRIEEKIFGDTMKCFSRFLDECRRKNGILFFDRGWWTYRQISMRLFRLGTLEYELSLWEGKPAVAVHIPSDADLSEACVNASFSQAENFFRTFFRKFDYEIYCCNSWLLSPVLSTMLSEDSKIRGFQKQFSIVEENQEDNSFMEWLFQTFRDTDIRELPEKTSLQKAVKNRLLSGEKIGSGRGIRKKQDNSYRLW